MLRLEISGPSKAGEELDVENRLGVAVDKLVIHARNDKYYYVDNLGAGTRCPAIETTPEEVRAWLIAVTTKNQPEYPLGFDARDWSRLNRSRYYYSNPWGAISEEFSDSRLEQAMGRLRGQTDPIKSELPPFIPGTYVALVSKSPGVELGIEPVKEEAGFNLILGEW